MQEAVELQGKPLVKNAALTSLDLMILHVEEVLCGVDGQRGHTSKANQILHELSSLGCQVTNAGV